MNIVKRLEDWSDSSNISKQTPSVVGYVANMSEENGEWLEATKKGLINDSVDAVADMAVFSITELFKKGIDYSFVDTILTYGSTYDYWIEQTRVKQDTTRNEFTTDVVILLGFFARELPNKDYLVIKTIIELCFNKMITMGYDPMLVMNEVLKVIESRTGKWDSVNNKFQKDTSPQAKLSWYKPNYVENARLK